MTPLSLFYPKTLSSSLFSALFFQPIALNPRSLAHQRPNSINPPPHNPLQPHRGIHKEETTLNPEFNQMPIN